MVALAISGCVEQKSVLPNEKPLSSSQPPPSPEPYFSGDCSRTLQLPDDLERARSDYKWRGDLIDEQQGRISTLYIVKAGVRMDQSEYKGWIKYLRAALSEYYSRACNHEDSGNNYLNQLNKNVNQLDRDSYLREFDRVKHNFEIVLNDANMNIAEFNSNVEKYNNCFVYKTGC